MHNSYKHFHRLAWAGLLLALCVIVFGGFVRLSNAGLSCPDWPTCYGKATWPDQAHEVEAANAVFERAVEVSKAWREQFHRHIAALLGLIVLSLCLLEAKRRKHAVWVPVACAAFVAASIPAYMYWHHAPAFAMAAAGILGLLGFAWRAGPEPFIRFTAVLLAVIIVQAMLGMWTVTWLLKPIVVMSHLIGGLTTFSLLTWLAWRSTPNAGLINAEAGLLKRLLWIGLALLVVQIALGGWTSSNYAALACGTEFPKCLGAWLPPHDFKEGFVLWRGIGVDYEGGVLDGPARVAIQLAHRGMAVIVGLYLLFLAVKLIRTPGLVYWGSLLLLAVLAQIALGISNVHFGLPLWVAVAHLAGAVLLLFIIVGLLARLRQPDQDIGAGLPQ
jgi:cytochrome c oxidase assembly protein subunit 15